MKTKTDPLKTGGTRWVFRGGSWYSTASSCRAANRGGFTPEFRYYYLGFRPVLKLKKKYEEDIRPH